LDIWDKTVEALQTSVKPYDFAHWIRPIRCDRVDAVRSEIVLSVPDDSHGRWLEEHFLTRISDAIATLTDTPYTVSFQTLEAPVVAPKASPTIAPTAPPPELVARYRFENFVAGPRSRFALTAAQSAAEQPGQRYNPLFIYGGVGLGKTHLLHAVGHLALAQNPAARVLYVSSETYVNDLIAAIRSGKMDRFRARYRDECDVLLIDDIQFIAGKDRTQEEFFHMFNTLHSSSKQIVMTCDQMPSAIPDLEERLRSRLQWGLIADIKPPSFETGSPSSSARPPRIESTSPRTSRCSWPATSPATSESSKEPSCAWTPRPASSANPSTSIPPKPTSTISSMATFEGSAPRSSSGPSARPSTSPRPPSKDPAVIATSPSRGRSPCT